MKNTLKRVIEIALDPVDEEVDYNNVFNYEEQIKDFSELQQHLFYSRLVYSRISHDGLYFFYHSPAGSYIFEGIEAFSLFGLKSLSELLKKTTSLFIDKNIDIKNRDERIKVMVDYATEHNLGEFDVFEEENLFPEICDIVDGGYYILATKYLLCNLDQLKEEQVNKIKDIMTAN